MSRISLVGISNTPPKQIKDRDENPLTINDIKYLDLHAEANPNAAEVSKAKNKLNNSKRERLIEFIFRMKDNNQFLKDPRWSHWYDESKRVKAKLQLMYKSETGETDDGTFYIRQLGGSKYPYDFTVRITNANNTKRTFIPLEYKHQSSLGILPQFYQVGNVTKPFFDVPYHEYYYEHGLQKVNKVMGVDIKLESADKHIYSKIIGKVVWTKQDWAKMLSDNGISTCAPINEQLRILRKNYEEGGINYTKRQRAVTQTIIDYLEEMKRNNGITLDLINQVEEVIITKQKPLDHNGMHKDKIYMLCEYTGGELKWKIDQYSPGDYRLIKDPSKVVVEKEQLFFPTESGKFISLRLRWQNVSGLCNPSWQLNVKSNVPKSRKKTVVIGTSTKKPKNTTVKTITVAKKSTVASKRPTTSTRCPKGTRKNRNTGNCEPNK